MFILLPCALEPLKRVLIIYKDLHMTSKHICMTCTPLKPPAWPLYHYIPSYGLETCSYDIPRLYMTSLLNGRWTLLNQSIIWHPSLCRWQHVHKNTKTLHVVSKHVHMFFKYQVNMFGVLLTKAINFKLVTIIDLLVIHVFLSNFSIHIGYGHFRCTYMHVHVHIFPRVQIYPKIQHFGGHLGFIKMR